MRSVRTKYNEMRRRRLNDKVSCEINKCVAMMGIILENALRKAEAYSLIQLRESVTPHPVKVAFVYK